MSPFFRRIATEVPPPSAMDPSPAIAVRAASMVVGAVKDSSASAKVGLHGVGDRDVARAAAEVARHVGTDLLFSCLRGVHPQRARRDDLARCADAALHP